MQSSKRAWSRRDRAGMVRRALFPPTNIWKSLQVARNENALLVKWPNRGRVARNWGDKLNRVLVERLSGKPVFNYFDVINTRHRPAYSVIGSSLSNLKDPGVIIWGTGFISYEARPPVVPKQICAVRGPLTRQKYVDAGIACPEVFGDPALLCPLLFPSNVPKTHVLGVIPQWRDQQLQELMDLANDPRVKLIDICGGIEEVIDAINACEHIASTSLHGLITADAYGVPSTWLRLSENPLGDLFKFNDYYASIGLPEVEPLRCGDKLALEDIVAQCWVKNLDIDLQALLAACPFYFPGVEKDGDARVSSINRAALP